MFTIFIAERKNFVFIKTHKTGTSTTVNILYNFGMTRGLNYAVYPYTHQLWAIEPSRQVNLSHTFKTCLLYSIQVTTLMAVDLQ